MPRYYSIRANGNTAHNDRAIAAAYVPGESPTYPETYFDYVDLCLQQGIARIGWPGTDDLSATNTIPVQIAAYPNGIPSLNRRQLALFRDIQINDVVILPRKGVNAFYIGDVTKPYHWYFNLPESPYECAHRIGVRWDRTGDSFSTYTAEEMHLSRRGFPFLNALNEICDRSTICQIMRARR